MCKKNILDATCGARTIWFDKQNPRTVFFDKRCGFRECMRVLKPDGVLIFKWSEYDIPASKVWKAIGQEPLFGHRSGKQSRTFWACFMK